ncbi:uncharacterized protein LOC143933286 [Lithobates pipiens]
MPTAETEVRRQAAQWMRGSKNLEDSMAGPALQTEFLYPLEVLERLLSAEHSVECLFDVQYPITIAKIRLHIKNHIAFPSRNTNNTGNKNIFQMRWLGKNSSWMVSKTAS